MNWNMMNWSFMNWRLISFPFWLNRVENRFGVRLEVEVGIVTATDFGINPSGDGSIILHDINGLIFAVICHFNAIDTVAFPFPLSVRTVVMPIWLGGLGLFNPRNNIKVL